jgi:hypothetical protein
MTEDVPTRLDASGEITLGHLIGASMSSNVFSVQGRPDLAVKYQSNCEEKRRTHPLTREFFMLKKVEHLAISPRAFVLSDAGQIDKPESV